MGLCAKKLRTADVKVNSNMADKDVFTEEITYNIVLVSRNCRMQLVIHVKRIKIWITSCFLISYRFPDHLCPTGVLSSYAETCLKAEKVSQNVIWFVIVPSPIDGLDGPLARSSRAFLMVANFT